MCPALLVGVQSRLFDGRALVFNVGGSSQQPVIASLPLFEQFCGARAQNLRSCPHVAGVHLVKSVSCAFGTAFFEVIIMSRYEELDSSGNDLFTSCAKLSDHEILVQHMVDIEKATTEFREACERKHAASSHTNSSRKRFATRSIVQRRLNPGPHRGKEDAFEQQIAGRWHIITLQEASEYVVTHCAGCAILFNKDTFCPNVDAKSIHLHDARRDLPSQVIEGEQGGSYKVFFHVPHFVDHQLADRSTLLCSNIHAKKGIAKKLILTLHTVMLQVTSMVPHGGTAARQPQNC